MQRVERVEDLDIFALRTQGIVSADGFIPISTASSRREASLPIIPIGCNLATPDSFSP
jgi:hypothetical protein